MKICAFGQSEYAKKAYSKESFNVRLFAGLAVTVDILRRSGFAVEYAGSANAYKYDIVLVSITSDCDWWDFVKERISWPKSECKVIVGGQGVLNVRPFLSIADYFVLGRAEGVISELVSAIGKGEEIDEKSVIQSSLFSVDKRYYINQTNKIYPHDITLESGEKYHEDVIGCNHRCLFCGYTWHRKNVQDKAFEYSGLWNGGKDRERAMIDLHEGTEVDMNKLRTTAIDGMSERLRMKMNKRITREMFREFLDRLAKCERPHQVKVYNIIGLPSETLDDWMEFKEDLIISDNRLPKTSRQTSILLHSTPFRAMPATPLACAPMSYKNYRGTIGSTLGRGLKGNIFFQGRSLWAVESMATESLPTVIHSAIVWRGTESDTDTFCKIATSKKYWSSPMGSRLATLEKHFDISRLFGSFSPDELPTKYINTYCNVEKMYSMKY